MFCGYNREMNTNITNKMRFIEVIYLNGIHREWIAVERLKIKEKHHANL